MNNPNKPCGKRPNNCNRNHRVSPAMTQHRTPRTEIASRKKTPRQLCQNRNANSSYPSRSRSAKKPRKLPTRCGRFAKNGNSKIEKRIRKPQPRSGEHQNLRRSNKNWPTLPRSLPRKPKPNVARTIRPQSKLNKPRSRHSKRPIKHSLVLKNRRLSLHSKRQTTNSPAVRNSVNKVTNVRRSCPNPQSNFQRNRNN